MKHATPTANGKYQDLLLALCALRSAVVAFSGGLDSTFLLHAAQQTLGHEVLAVTMVTAYMPEAEILDARNTARAMDVPHLMLEIPFSGALRPNPPERCYLCKRDLFTRMRDLASARNIRHVLDGTNLDDLADHRPGRKALQELGIESPLLATGLTKQDIRDLSRDHGLAAWDKPATPCLLTRIPHGTTVTQEDLRRIDQAECFLKDLGFPTVRVRSHGTVARIEVPHAQLAAVIEANRHHDIDARLKALGYTLVTVDLAGYRMGNMNETTM